MEIGDNVMVQNQAGNKPPRWSRSGVILEVLPHRQYNVLMDGSRRVSLRNRKFLRKFTPLHRDVRTTPQQTHDPVHRDDVRPPVHHDQQPLHEDTTSHNPSPYPPPEVEQEETPPAAKQTDNTAVVPPPIPAPPVDDWPAPEQHTHRSEPPPLPVLMHPTPSPVRRSNRSNKGTTRKYDDYETGERFDAACTNSLQSNPYQYQAVAYPTINLSGYNVPCPTYDQLYQIRNMQHHQPHTEYDASSFAHNHMLNQIYSEEVHQRDYHQPEPYRVFSPVLNKVFVFDGRVWNEFSLENVFPSQIPYQESPGGGT